MPQHIAQKLSHRQKTSGGKSAWDNFDIQKWYKAKTGNKIIYTGLSKKMDGIWNRYNLKSTGRIYTFGVLKYSEKFKVLDLL